MLLVTCYFLLPQLLPSDFLKQALSTVILFNYWLDALMFISSAARQK
ncbi:MAG: hypothetical protein F6K31_29105 [Symploca sp. SIO2G7]|nr:hypothetical protein [Symploca sp. SIO2G7]